MSDCSNADVHVDVEGCAVCCCRHPALAAVQQLQQCICLSASHRKPTLVWTQFQGRLWHAPGLIRAGSSLSGWLVDMTMSRPGVSTTPSSTCNSSSSRTCSAQVQTQEHTMHVLWLLPPVFDSVHFLINGVVNNCKQQAAQQQCILCIVIV
jgi:hypothetical protein